MREEFIMDSPVVGTKYIKNIGEIEKDLYIGDSVALKREPENSYDELAIMVLDGKMRKMGYIPREKNRDMALMMDKCEILFGKINEKLWDGSSLNLKLSIFRLAP